MLTHNLMIPNECSALSDPMNEPIAYVLLVTYSCLVY